jgi:anti-sigma-K factor RskA
MRNLQDLHNNEAILLMYLAGELTPQDHAEVEQMLGTDATLRHELASLQQMQEQITGSLAELDRHTRPAVPQAFAEAGIYRMIRQWHEQRRRMTRTLVLPRRVMPRVWFGLATAASIIIGYFVWLAYHPSTPTSPAGVVNTAAADEEKVTLMENTMMLSDGQAESDMQFAAVMPGPDDLDSPPDSSNQ